MTTALRPGVGKGFFIDGTYVTPDDGCDVAPSCLRCPLEFCRYDVPLYVQRRVAREREIRRLVDQDLPVRVIAARVGLSERVVYRFLQNERSAA